MTKRQALLPLIASASRSSGSSTLISEISSIKTVLIILNVTIAPGTSLDLAVDFQDPISLNFIRCQTRFVGRNINGAFTIGDWTLGAFRQMVAADQVPYTEARALTDSEVLPQQIRLTWTVVGTQPTFSISVIGDTEEG